MWWSSPRESRRRKNWIYVEEISRLPPFFGPCPLSSFPRPETPKNAWKGKYTYAGWKSPSQLENAENGENRCQIPDASYRSAKERVGSW